MGHTIPNRDQGKDSDYFLSQCANKRTSARYLWIGDHRELLHAAAFHPYLRSLLLLRQLTKKT